MTGVAEVLGLEKASSAKASSALKGLSLTPATSTVLTAPLSISAAWATASASESGSLDGIWTNACSCGAEVRAPAMLHATSR